MSGSDTLIIRQGFLSKFYKFLTLVLFFIFPVRLALTFINLSILAIVYDVRNISFNKDKINTDKIHKLLKIAINEEILLFPNYTINWFWSEEFLNSKAETEQGVFTLRELISNPELCSKHLRLVVDMFIDHLPKSLKFKLGVQNIKNRIFIKHNIMTVLTYS